MTRNSRNDLTREMIDLEKRENFKYVWNDSETLAEAAGRLERTARSVRATFHALRKIGIMLPELPSGAVHPNNTVYHPSPEEIKRKCEEFRASYSEAALNQKLRCDHRPISPSINEISNSSARFLDD